MIDPYRERGYVLFCWEYDWQSQSSDCTIVANALTLDETKALVPGEWEERDGDWHLKVGTKRYTISEYTEPLWSDKVEIRHYPQAWRWPGGDGA